MELQILIMRIRKSILLYGLVLFGFMNQYSSCNLEQNINIELPEYEPQVVVECYLVPGQPYSATLVRSVGYFEPYVDTTNPLGFNLPLVSGATVTIEHLGTTHTLTPGFYGGAGNKFFNYQSSSLVPASYNTPFNLKITTAEGETVSAQTMMLEPIPIDSNVLDLDADNGKFRVLTYLKDRANEENYFRRMLWDANVLSDSLRQDFVTDDAFLSGQSIIFGTGADYETGDTIITWIYHISNDFYRFVDSWEAAQDANGNPFAIPSPVLTNIEGGTGIFTGLNVAGDTVIVP